MRTNICGEMVTLKLWILGTGGEEIVPRFLLIKFIRSVKHSFWQIKLHKLQIMMENCNYKKRKTGNFWVVQFSRNSAVSINPRKLKSAKYFPIFEKLCWGTSGVYGCMFAVITLFACGKTSNVQLSQNNLLLQATWLEVKWSMTDPIYSMSRWLMYLTYI